jgi:putative membrane-bound dehydrogenase-like protein
VVVKVGLNDDIDWVTKLVMMKWCFLWLALGMFVACSKPQPRKIEVLFLGHNSLHHNSEKYLPILASALANKGVNFTYTAEPSDLNDKNLSRYDALMLYANHDSISTDQELALLKFVDSGKGFLPIHSASYCFRNSEAYIELVGAQFKSHGTGVFKAQVINLNHPVTDGYQSFESWDETYVSHRHNPDRTVLMERIDSAGGEPWTWVRNYGKGRVFYTASGHDERTWRHTGFQDLLLRAIIWAVGDEVKNLWQGLELPTHQYVASENIANYEKRTEPLMLQKPFTQSESEKLIQVPAGFRLEVVAEEPDIVNPMFLNWDHLGRLWVIESVDYPNEVNPDGVGKDRIKICEDTDGDGKADKFTVFADSLNIPTSFVFSNGGIVVSAAPNFLFLKDTDGDDRADQKQVLFRGWGTFDTHAGPSNLKYGFDNYIWGTVGYSAFEGTVAGNQLKFGQGIYRFNPEVTDFEYVTATSNNTWGLGFSETFDVFASTANNAHSWYLGIPDRYFKGIQGIPRKGSKNIAGYYAFHPITENIRQVDVFGGFTAAAGHNLYTARQFPS